MFNVDLKELIFLGVFVGVIAVPIILSAISRKKSGNRDKEKDRG